MLKYKIIGCGAAGNKAVISLKDYFDGPSNLILLNSTDRDIPKDTNLKTIIFGNGLGGCGKERKLGKSMILETMKEDSKQFDGLIDPDDSAIILVGSTEGGSGSASIPILAKYFKEVHGKNVICVLFFGFQDDTRGLQNSIEICQELSEDYGVIAISNAKFLDDCNGNKYKAEIAANTYFTEVIKILSGATIDEANSTQVIDNTDLYKIVTTPGYMMVGNTTFKSSKSIDEFNAKLKTFMDDHKFIDPPKNAGMKREAIIITCNQDDDNINFSFTPISDLYGIPYEKFTNLRYHKDRDILFSYILSGMKMPIDEISDIYSKYIETSAKVDKSSDSFIDKVNDMRGDAEDDQFDMMTKSQPKTSSKSSFFESFGVKDSAKPAEPKTTGKKKTEVIDY